MSKSTNSINLLPQWAKESKQRRKTIFALVGLQVVIFLLLYAIVSVFYRLEEISLANANSISEDIRAFNPEWEQAAANASAAIVRRTQMDEFFELHSTYWFEPVWLYVVVDATPSESQLIRLEYSNSQILLIAKSADISVAEVHRREIIATDFFYYARVGNITGLGDGLYSYELRIAAHG